ncbi:class F sortase [Streptomyces ruber]|uniref:Class F sortase n=2 Tax=Streptomyces TaxID=1883 RepID=A0A918EV09_9ACTN|nr:class F sortase [Streptomyces ruber]GGQ76526.1 class F sortase [Streptomyces ruber]
MTRRRRAAVFLMVCGLTVCGLGAVAAGWLTWSMTRARPDDAGSLPAGVHRAVSGDAREASAPVRVHGPAGLDAAVVPVAARADGDLALPSDPRTGGWWSLGAQAGAPAGTVLIAGHVDSRRGGLGPFAALHETPVGADVTVTGADAEVRRYRVTARRTYRREKLPTDLFARTGPHRLALLTCAGPYDRGSGRYARNLVLYAAPRPGRLPRPGH